MIYKANKKNKFDYGDSVRVKKSSPKKYFPGEPGDICGMVQIFSNEGEKKYICQKEDWVYTFEFPDGSSMEIAECYLEPDPDRLKYRFNEKVIMKSNISEEYHPSKIVLISGYHHISKECIAKKFNLKRGGVIYIVKTEYEEEFFSPESFIEKKVESNDILS